MMLIIHCPLFSQSFCLMRSLQGSHVERKVKSSFASGPEAFCMTALPWMLFPLLL